MTTHPFDRLALDDGAAVLLTPCPGTKGVSLRDSLSQLAQAGAKSVITLMPLEEMEKNGVSEMPALCAELGLAWFHFPIEDDASPGEAFRQAWESGKGPVFEILDRSGTVAIHCKGGSGRTGLMAAIILCERGMGHDRILDQVKALRPNALKLAVHTDYLQQACVATEGWRSAET